VPTPRMCPIPVLGSDRQVDQISNVVAFGTVPVPETQVTKAIAYSVSSTRRVRTMRRALR
jgi:hypothetical protein